MSDKPFVFFGLSNGNLFSLVAACKLQATEDLGDLWPQFQTEVFSSDYQHALSTIRKYFDFDEADFDSAVNR